MSGLTVGEGFPAANRGVYVARVQFHGVADATRLLGRDDGGPTAEEGVQDDAVAFGAVSDCVGDEGDGLYGRVECPDGPD